MPGPGLQFSEVPNLNLLLVLLILLRVVDLGFPRGSLVLVILKNNEPLLQESSLDLINRLRRVGKYSVLRGALAEVRQHVIRLFDDSDKGLILSFDPYFIFDVVGPLCEDAHGGSVSSKLQFRL